MNEREEDRCTQYLWSETRGKFQENGVEADSDVDDCSH